MAGWGALGISLCLCLGYVLAGCDARPEVVVYCAQDQGYAEVVFGEFTRESGVQVRAVFDSEAVKTVGLVNRILAERQHPVADVYWGNEEFQTRRLAALGAFRPTNGWASFGKRSRRLVAGANRPELARIGLSGLTNAALRGRVAMAAPWFGSTATHLTALRSEWGDTAWHEWCRALAANHVFLEEGNSQVVKRVARGEAWVGLTDSDDILAAQAEGSGVTAGPELWPLRNTVAIVGGTPRGVAAEKLFEFLQSTRTQELLIRLGAIEATPGVVNEPHWEDMLLNFDLTGRQLREHFKP